MPGSSSDPIPPILSILSPETPMPDAPPDLVALVGSRIAHDLANPLGAIANGVELLALTGQGNSAELQLITESVANATARIKAFRIAFGAAPPGQTVKAADIAALFP
jgi:histidine phosphotransferase ChpT